MTAAPVRTLVTSVLLLVLPATVLAVGPDWVQPEHDMAQLNAVRSRPDVGMNVNSVSISPDGRLAALCGSAPALGVWDVATGRRLPEFESGWTTYAVAFAPDGKTVAAASWNPDGYRVIIHQVSTGRELRRLPGSPQMLSSLDFAPDGKAVASATEDGVVHIWDPASGKETAALKGHKGPVPAVAFAPDGAFLASAGHDGTVRLWDPAAWKELRACQGHRGRVAALAFTPDGKGLVSAGWDGTVRLWDPATAREVRRFTGHGPGVFAVAVAPGGKAVASGGADGTLRLWDLATGKETAKVNVHPSGTVALQAVAFTPDGKGLITGEEENGARLRDPATGRERLAWGHYARYSTEDYLASAAVSPDGRTVALGTGGRRVRLWDWKAKTMTDFGRMPDCVTALAWSPDGKTLATGCRWDGTVSVWDVATRKMSQPFEPLHPDGVTALTFTRDGKAFAVGGRGADAVAVFDVATGQALQKLAGHPGGVDDLDFAPDAKTLATGGADGTFRLWDVAAGKELWQAEGVREADNRVRFSPDGSLVAAAAGPVVTLRDARTGEARRTITTFHKAITALAYAPDGKTVATVAAKGWVGVWDAETGKERLTLKGGYVQEGGIVSGGWWSVGYLPDSQGLVTTDQWITGIVWDLTGRRGLKGKSPVTVER